MSSKTSDKKEGDHSHGAEKSGKNSSTLALVCDAIKFGGDEKHGSSVQAIKKYINEKRSGLSVTNQNLRKALDKGMKDGTLVRDDKAETASLVGRYKVPKVKPSGVNALKKPKTKKEKEAGKENVKIDHEENDHPVKMAKKGGTSKAVADPNVKFASISEKTNAKPRSKTEAKIQDRTKPDPKKPAKKEPVTKKNSSKKSKQNPIEESKSDSETHVPEKVRVIRRRRSKSESEVSAAVVAKPIRKTKVADLVPKETKRSKAPRH